MQISAVLFAFQVRFALQEVREDEEDAVAREETTAELCNSLNSFKNRDAPFIR